MTESDNNQKKQAMAEQPSPLNPELAALIPKLERAARDKVWGQAASVMLELIGNLEEVQRLAACNEGFCGYIDARQSMTDYVWAQKHLKQASINLAAAGRCIAHTSTGADRQPPE